jgi:hypothetical protein
MDILQQLGIRVVPESAIPAGFERLTTPVNLETEAYLLESMWSTLRPIAAIGVVSNGADGYMVEFYRQQLRRAKDYDKRRARATRVVTGTQGAG